MRVCFLPRLRAVSAGRRCFATSASASFLAPVLQLYGSLTGEQQRQQAHEAFQMSLSELTTTLRENEEFHRAREQIIENGTRDQADKAKALEQAQFHQTKLDRSPQASPEEKNAAFLAVVNLLNALPARPDSESLAQCQHSDQQLRKKFEEWKSAYNRKNEEDSRYHERAKLLGLVVGPVVTILSFALTFFFRNQKQLEEKLDHQHASQQGVLNQIVYQTLPHKRSTPPAQAQELPATATDSSSDPLPAPGGPEEHNQVNTWVWWGLGAVAVAAVALAGSRN